MAEFRVHFEDVLTMSQIGVRLVGNSSWKLEVTKWSCIFPSVFYLFRQLDNDFATKITLLLISLASVCFESKLLTTYNRVFTGCFNIFKACTLIPNKDQWEDIKKIISWWKEFARSQVQVIESHLQALFHSCKNSRLELEIEHPKIECQLMKY